MSRCGGRERLRLGHLVPGDATALYEVTGHPFIQPDGQVGEMPDQHAHRWRESFVCGDADDVTPVGGT